MDRKMLKIKDNIITVENIGLYSNYIPELYLNIKEIIPGDVIEIRFNSKGSKDSQLDRDNHKIIVTETSVEKGVWKLLGIVSNKKEISVALTYFLFEIMGNFNHLGEYTGRSYNRNKTYIKKISYFETSIKDIKVLGRINLFDNKRDLIKDRLEIQI